MQGGKDANKIGGGTIRSPKGNTEESYKDKLHQRTISKGHIWLECGVEAVRPALYQHMPHSKQIGIKLGPSKKATLQYTFWSF